MRGLAHTGWVAGQPGWVCWWQTGLSMARRARPQAPLARVLRRDTTMLAAGSVLSGLLAYVFFAAMTRGLGPVAAAPVSVLWTYWTFAAAALTFPVQHWIARSVAAQAVEGAVRQALPRVASVMVATAMAAGALAWAARDALFHRDDVWFPLMLTGVTLGSGFVGVVRGALAARGRFTSLAAQIMSENAVRCLGAIVLLTLDVQSAVAYGLCLVCGALTGLWWPSSLRFSAHPRIEERHESSLAFLSRASSGQLLAQAILTGSPVLLTLGGGTALQVTTLFAALALFRAPYTFGLGVVPQLTGTLTRMVVNGRRAPLRWMVGLILVATAFNVVVGAAVGATVGGPLVELVFGEEVTLPRPLLVLVAVGSAFALSNLFVTVVVMAQNRPGAVARAWLLGAFAAGTCFVLAGLPPLDRTCVAFVAAESVAFAILTVSVVRGTDRR